MKRSLILLLLPLAVLGIGSGIITISKSLTEIKRSDQKSYQSKYEKLLVNSKYDEVVQNFKTIYQRGKLEQSNAGKIFNSVPAELMGFRDALFKAKKSKELAEILKSAKDVESRTSLAELLLYTAVGDNHYSAIYSQITTNLNDELAQLAADLMVNDSDPFVRAIAEQALAAKVNRENDGPNLRWPKQKENPAWFLTWINQSPDKFLEYDYVRQALQQGVHHSILALTGSAAEIVQRAELFSADLINRGLDPKVLKKKLSAIRELSSNLEKSKNLTDARIAWLKLRLAGRELVMLSPDMAVSDFVYVKRRNHLVQHNIANGEPMANRFPPGTDILRKTDFDPSKKPVSILGDKLGAGSIRGLDLYYDADRVVFSFTPQSDKNLYNWDFRKEPVLSESNLYEINVDGSGLKQVTSDVLQADQAPCYLPNGDIVFASSRGDIGSECGPWPQHAVTMNLFKVAFQKDGSSEVKRLTHNKDFDHYPHVLNNGLVGFTRWDYQERHFYYPHTIWSCRPDGTQSDLIYKSHLSDGPHSLRDAMPVPNSNKLFAIACGHHSIPEGALALIELTSDLNDPSGISYVTPLASETEGGYGAHAKAVAEGGVRDAMAMGTGGFYQTPWPLSDKSVLISAMYEAAKSCAGMIYYVDVFGNKELLARDLIYELIHPKLVKARKKPPVLPDVTNPSKLYAEVYVNDVYDGLEGVKRGDARYIRIVNKVNWPYGKGETPYGVLRWFVDQGSSPTFGFYNWSPTRVVGTVPVEDDGSAYFRVPVEMALTFQLLDADKREIRRMRSHVEFMRGETRGCTGCHETRAYSTNPMPKKMMALKRNASMPTPPAFEGGDRVLLDYVKHVQPVFNKHCISCHGTDKPAAGIEFTNRPDAFGFLQSYRSLFGFKYGDKLPVGGDWWYQTYYPEEYEKFAVKGDKSSPEERAKMVKMFEQIINGTYPGQLVKVISRRSDASLTQPYQAGSYKSKLIMHLFDDPEHIAIRKKLSPAEWETLVSFVDNNAPATGWFYAKRDKNGKEFKRKVNGRSEEDLMRVYIQYSDPWDDRKPNDDNGTPVWPAIPTKIQIVDSARLVSTQSLK